MTPAASVTWAHDVFGNAVATAGFEGLTRPAGGRQRGAVSRWAPIRGRCSTSPPSRSTYPFAYTDADWSDLGALVVPQYPDPERNLLAWAQRLRAQRPDRHALAAEGPRAQASPGRSATRAARAKAPRRRSRRWRAGWARAATSRCCSSRRRAACASGRALCSGYLFRPDRETETTKPIRRMPGPRSTCRARAGSPSIRPTAASADAT